MEVLLKENVEFLGEKDELVTVKAGYGRNYLIPTGKAILATESVKKMHAETLRQRAHKATKVLDEAKALADKIQAVAVKVGAKVGDSGKIFGSVTNVQIAEGLRAQGIDIDRKRITIKGDAIKEVGNYKANVRLHKEVIIEIPFEVVEE